MESLSMASDLFRNSIHHSMIPFHHQNAKSVLLGRPKKLRVINSQTSNLTLPKFQIDEYISLKEKKLTKGLDEAIPLKHPAILHEAMKYSLISGGISLFGILSIASCVLVGGSESMAMPLGCATEMISTMALMQDDLPCLDNEELRGGKLVSHKVFGEAATVLACQSLLLLAIEHIATKTKNVSPDRLLRAIAELCSALGSEGLSAGQIMDLKSEGKEVSLSEIDFIHVHKTAKVFQAVMVSGAVIGGGSEEEIEKVSKCAKSIGLAYQGWDDTVDVIGSPAMTEKTGRDMLRDKATYPKLMGIDKAKKYAMENLDEAKQELAYFDPVRAAPLYHMFDHMISW